MIGLLIAASIATSPPWFVAPQQVCRRQGAVQTSYEPALLLRPQDRAAIRLQRLGDLPKANFEIAVERQIGGCASPVVIGYRVEGDGRAATDGR